MDRLTATNRLNDGGRLLVENPQAADLDVPLTNSIIPQRGVGPVTYSRATIATVTDHEWVIRDCIAGEARFQWARRVRNLTWYSQALDNASWTKNSTTISGTKVAYADGSLIGQKVIASAANAQHYVVTAGAFVASNTLIWSASIKAAGYDFAQLMTAGAVSVNYQNFDLINGVMTGTAGVGTMVDEWDGWWRCSMRIDSIATLSAYCYILIPSSMSDTRFPAFLGDAVNGIYVTRVQLEDVTGQSVQTASEYVSTNVLNAAPYHGSNVDGVKCFKTTLAWLPISPSTLKGFLCEWARTNLFLQSQDFLTTWWLVGIGAVTTNQTTAPNGTMTADLFTLAASFGAQWVTQSLTTTASVYAQSIYVKSNGHNFVQCNAAGGISLWYVNFDLSTGTVTTQSLWTGTIESLPDGWYRLKVVTNTISATTANVSFAAVPSSTATRGQTAAGTGTSWFYIWGAQFELWWVVSSYIPTTTTTVTRNIDVLTYDVKNAIANQWAFSGIFYMDDNAQFDRRAFNFSGSNNNRLQFQSRRSSPWYVNLFYWDGAGVQSVATTQNAWVNNIAVSWTNWVGAYIFMNNTKYSSGVAPSLAFSTVDVGGGNGTLPIFWCVKNVRIWKTVPTDAELLSLSNQS